MVYMKSECRRCYDTQGVVVDGVNHPVICDYVECDEDHNRFVCIKNLENPITLFVKRRMQDGVVVEKFIDYPVEGCPNGGPKVYVIGLARHKKEVR